MELHEENEVLNWIDTFSVPVIPRTKRFWMIRTKKGIFIMSLFRSALLH